MQPSRLLFALVIVLGAFSALTSACGNQTYADLGGKCESNTDCKNFLTCDLNQSVCIEPSYKTNCTGNPSICGTGELYCNSNNTCDVRLRENGDYCVEDSQCLSSSCLNGTCVGKATLGTPCTLSTYASTYECAAGLFCLPSLNGTGETCQKPYNYTVDCSAAMDLWNQNNFSLISSSLLPVGICAPGSACLRSEVTNTSTCVVLFNTTANKTCERQSEPLPGAPQNLYTLDMGCHYNLACSAPPANSNFTSAYICTYGAQDTPKNCSVSPCPFGQTCGCSNSTKRACNTWVFGDVCDPLLTDLMTCLRKSQCAYRASTLPQQEQIFAGLSYAPWCVSRACGRQHQRFLCCQNNQTELESGQFAFTPLRLPKQNGYCNLDNGWPNWVVPVIVLGGIVLVVAVIVALYLVVRRKPDADYDPINK